jgi:DNA topoisomerase-3
MRVLCVAEKPSISKAVATHLAGGSPQVGNTRVTHIKNYGFDFDFNQGWGTTSVTMTCVIGHLTNLDFPQDFKNWQFPPPDRLFTAPVNTVIPQVSE